MTAGEEAARRAIEVAERRRVAGASDDEAARRWLRLMKGVGLCINGRRCEVVALVEKDGGVNELGVWWNDQIGSTHVRPWGEVLADLAHPPEDTRSKCQDDARGGDR